MFTKYIYKYSFGWVSTEITTRQQPRETKPVKITMFNEKLWLDLIRNDSFVKQIKAAWEKYAEINFIDYETMEDLIPQLPAKNIFLELSPEEIYEVVKSCGSWKKATKSFLASILGDEIRAFQRAHSGSSRSMRKIWYKFKPMLQSVYKIVFNNGEYKKDPDTDVDFYDVMPRNISVAAQYWCTAQISKETEWLGVAAVPVRDAVCKYEDLGIQDISRMRFNVRRKILFKHFLNYLKEFENGQAMKEQIEENNAVLINLYKPLKDIITDVEKILEDDFNSQDEIHFVLMVEKDAEFDLLRPMGEYIGINVISGHGQNSISSLEKLINNLDSNGKTKIIFMSITDHDPAGLKIARAPAEQQFEKCGVEVLFWSHSMWQLNIPTDQRQQQCYIPKMQKKSGKYGVFDQNWIDSMGYDKDKDVFGGGLMGFELEALEDDQLKNAFAEVVSSIGFTAENMLESCKDRNREDPEDCAEDSATEYVDNTQIAKDIDLLREYRNRMTDPIDELIDEYNNVRSDMIEAVKEELVDSAKEYSEDPDFDDRDVSRYVNSYWRDFKAGKETWSQRWGAEVCNSRVLSAKLVEMLNKLHDEISVCPEDFDLTEIDVDDLLEKTKAAIIKVSEDDEE